MEHCLSPAAPPDKTASGAISPGPLRGHNSLSRLPDNFQRSRVTLLDCLLQEVNFLLSYRTKITILSQTASTQTCKYIQHVYKCNRHNTALFSGDKYMFSGDHQKKLQPEPEGSRFWASHCGALMLSGQPRFPKSHALITCPSVEIALKEGVVSKLRWHTFSRPGRGWGEPSPPPFVTLHMRLQGFLYRAICIAEKLSHGRQLHYYDEFMQKSAVFSQSVHEGVEDRERGRARDSH